jgi:DNA-binding NarL/FixJ family response regulator
MMPGLSGIDLYREVIHAHPWLAARFVFITGVSGANQVQRMLQTTERRVLEKPIARDQLLAVCRELGPRGSETPPTA